MDIQSCNVDIDDIMLENKMLKHQLVSIKEQLDNIINKFLTIV